MLDFDAGKLLIIGVVALLVIGPKDLPRVLRQAGQAIARLKRMAGEFQGQFMDAMREADLEAIRDDLKKTTADVGLDTHFDPARDIQRELTGSVNLADTGRLTEPATMAALEPSVPSVMDGFTMARPVDPEGEVSPADAGAVPIAETLEVADQADAAIDAYNPVVDPPSRKRRIRVRRRVHPAGRTHAVLDRTALRRSSGASAAGQRANL